MYMGKKVSYLHMKSFIFNEKQISIWLQLPFLLLKGNYCYYFLVSPSRNVICILRLMGVSCPHCLVICFFDRFGEFFHSSILFHFRVYRHVFFSLIYMIFRSSPVFCYYMHCCNENLYLPIYIIMSIKIYIYIEREAYVFMNVCD